MSNAQEAFKSKHLDEPRAQTRTSSKYEDQTGKYSTNARVNIVSWCRTVRLQPVRSFGQRSVVSGRSEVAGTKQAQEDRGNDRSQQSARPEGRQHLGRDARQRQQDHQEAQARVVGQGLRMAVCAFRRISPPSPAQSPRARASVQASALSPFFLTGLPPSARSRHHHLYCRCRRIFSSTSRRPGRAAAQVATIRAAGRPAAGRHPANWRGSGVRRAARARRRHASQGLKRAPRRWRSTIQHAHPIIIRKPPFHPRVDVRALKASVDVPK